MNYFTIAVIFVLEGGPLTANDKFSFDLPPIQSAADWESLKVENCNDAECLARLVEKLSEDRLEDDFTDKKYESYYKNIQGIIEHVHYHLGQIVLLKKMVIQNNLS